MGRDSRGKSAHLLAEEEAGGAHDHARVPRRLAGRPVLGGPPRSGALAAAGGSASRGLSGGGRVGQWLGEQQLVGLQGDAGACGHVAEAGDRAGGERTGGGLYLCRLVNRPRRMGAMQVDIRDHTLTPTTYLHYIHTW